MDSLWKSTVPVARAGDPGTSWAAADSVSPEHIRQSYGRILSALYYDGPATDETILKRLQGDGQGPVTPSGARSRRSELVRMGWIVDSGRKEKLESGRLAIVWEMPVED